LEKDVRTFVPIMEELINLSNLDDEIRTIIIVGSQARTYTPADEWSDLDVVMFVQNPDEYLLQTKWLESLGEPMITFLENTAVGGGTERRVMFDSGLDVDFSVFSASSFDELMSKDEVQNVLAKGYKVLVDKDNRMEDKTHHHVVPTPAFPPSSFQIQNDIHDFWYHAIRASTKLRRGEILVAKSDCDTYMLHLLLNMLRVKVRLEKGEDYETWYGYRFFEKWADPKDVERFTSLFPHYDEKEIWQSLDHIMAFYQEVSQYVCFSLNVDYPSKAASYANTYIQQLRS